MSANLGNSAVATGLEKVSFFIQIPKKCSAKNVQTTNALTSYAGKVISFKIGFSGM